MMPEDNEASEPLLQETDRHAICDYTATMLKGLEKMAREGGLPVLAHLISLARFEANSHQ